ncbi:hypothetical protein BKA69DRAFT_1168599 [Paraphysoderma sedebokerense]|nr:hypothetical protein BKA69DRAFT_1168599 [Paraphysoderma sedebokerense]
MKRKTIADVPNEILSLIFRDLDKNSLKNVISVCQRFFDEGTPLLWSTVLRFAGTSQDEEEKWDSPILLAQALSKPATNRSYELLIKKLDIIVASSLSVEHCYPIQHFFGSLPHLLNLTHFNLTFGTLWQESSDFLEKMESNIPLAFIELMKLPRLKVLNVESLDVDIMCQVLENEYNYSLENSTIAEMSLSNLWMPVSGGSFQRFIQFFKALESLQLWEVDALSISLWAEILSSETITRLEVHNACFETVEHPSVFSRLRKLSIESSLAGESILREFMGITTLEEVYFYDYEVSATSLAEFFQSNTALRHVKLFYYPLDPSYLVPLLQHCPNIETFTTFEPVENSVQVLDEMVKNHPNLRLPMFQFDRVHGLKRNYEEYLRIFPRLANHLKFI